MKNNFKNLILLVVILLCVLAAWGYAKFNNSKSLDKSFDQTTSNQISDVAQQATDTGEVMDEGESSDKDSKKVNIVDKNSFYNIEAAYSADPLDRDSKMKEYVEAVVAKRKDEWKIGGKIYNEEQKLAKEFAKDFPDIERGGYEMNIDYTRVFSKKMNTVTYIYNNYEFTGGAHGSTEVATFTFNKDGIVMIDKMLNMSSNNDIAISKIIAKKLPAILGEYTDTQMINDGLGLSNLKADGVTLDKAKCNCDGFFFGSNLQNFKVTDSGIVFIMGQYQVAPYVAGMPEVLLTWEDLKDYLIK